MGELTCDQETAAMEGLVTNAFFPPSDRLQLARQVIERLHARERERVRTAVVETLRYARVYWVPEDARALTFVEDLASAEELTRSWDMEPGWCCPFCEEVECDSDCPLAGVRGEPE
jgi:hypothetical protein